LSSAGKSTPSGSLLALVSTYALANILIDFLYAMTFILYLNLSKEDLNEKKQKLTRKCQKQKEEDAAALAEEGI
jgi:hypothetical protein